MRERTAKKRNKKKTATFAADDPRASSLPTSEKFSPIMDSFEGKFGIFIVGNDGKANSAPVGKAGRTLSCKPCNAAPNRVN